MIDLGIRIGHGAVLLEVNGAWISLALGGSSKPGRSVVVEFGRLRDQMLEPERRRARRSEPSED